MPDLTYAELFAGAGGLSIGLEMAGWKAVAHAEIEPHARAVLRYKWPDVRLDGDVAAINGADYAGVTLLSGGSPCQDLSIAGKRKGLEGERSGLFHQQVRIWRESGAPLFLWENVLGALSSNKGEDFGVVLSTIVGGAVPVPADGWGGAGVASGPAGVAAWRVLDGQFFGQGTLGTPQRRRRVFVLGVADGSVDPAEVLSLGESLSGHPASGREAGEGVAADSGTGVESASKCLTPWDNQSKRVFASDGNTPSLQAAEKCGQQQPAVLPSVSATITSKWAKGVGGPAGSASETSNLVVTFSTPAIGDIRQDDVASTITKNSGGGGETQNPAFVLTYDTRGNGDGQVVNTMAGDHQNRVTDYTALVFTRQRTDEYAEKGVASTIAQRDYKSVTDIIAGIGIPRRLTPVECERLMSWPDNHTALGIDEKGREYALSDTARYKLCGNGVLSACVAWIGMRLKDALDTPRERA